MTSQTVRTIWIDRDAAGQGWFVDATPARAEEFFPVGRRHVVSICSRSSPTSSAMPWVGSIRTKA